MTYGRLHRISVLAQQNRTLPMSSKVDSSYYKDLYPLTELSSSTVHLHSGCLCNVFTDGSFQFEFLFFPSYLTLWDSVEMLLLSSPVDLHLIRTWFRTWPMFNPSLTVTVSCCQPIAQLWPPTLPSSATTENKCESLETNRTSSADPFFSPPCRKSTFSPVDERQQPKHVTCRFKPYGCSQDLTI